MSYQEIYKTNYSRIVRESVLKSIIYGALIGLGVAIVIALATMFTDFNGIWLALGALIAVAVALSLVFYFVKFRPTDKYVAEKFDRMGFDERFITMLEHQDDESYIAKLQREDTVAVMTTASQKNNGKIAVRKTSEKLEAVGLTTRNIIIAVAVFAVAVVALTFTALPNQRVREIMGVIPEYNVEYSAGENGFIVTSDNGYALDKSVSGLFRQDVKEGGASSNIVVTANHGTLRQNEETGAWEFVGGYVFAGWDDMDPDGTVNPSRSELNVRAPIKVSALYEAMIEPEDENFGGSGSGSGNGGGNPSDGNDNMPMEDGDPNGNGSAPPDGPPSQSNSGSPGSSASNGNVFDGETNYQESFSGDYDAAMGDLSDGDIPGRLHDFGESYFNGLK